MIDERRIKEKLQREANRVMPDVLANVYREIGLEPQKAKPRWRWPFGKIATFSTAMTFLVIAVLLIPTFINGPIVASAETSIKLKIIPAVEEDPGEGAIYLPAIKYLPNEEDTPIFSFKIDRYGKTLPLDENKNNAIYAENDSAKMLAVGLGLENTMKKSPVELVLSLARLSREAGYIKSYAKGNAIVYRLSGEDAAYQVRLKANIEAELRYYFKAELIYGIAYEDENMDLADFSNYVDFSGQADNYRSSYDNRRSDHKHDDDRRGSGWGSDIDQWMSDHHNDHMSDTGSGHGR